LQDGGGTLKAFLPAVRFFSGIIMRIRGLLAEKGFKEEALLAKLHTRMNIVEENEMLKRAQDALKRKRLERRLK
jgi:hypothetical protein